MGLALLLEQGLHCSPPIFKWVQVINTKFNVLLEQSLRHSQQVGLLLGDQWPSLLNRQRRAQRHRPGYESFIYSTLFCNRFALKIEQSRLSCSFLPVQFASWIIQWSWPHCNRGNRRSWEYLVSSCFSHEHWRRTSHSGADCLCCKCCNRANTERHHGGIK